MEFESAYKRLNPAQKEAVDTTEGPVLVVAGPGTGKTQVLALRIANILKETDTKSGDILCLTFTNSGVREMRNRLIRLIGAQGSRVTISTFHSFGMNLLEEFYSVLGFESVPTLADEKDSLLLIDELLEHHSWQYLRSRNGGAHNFRDITSLISLLKRLRMTADIFEVEIETEIRRIQDDPENLSSRGATKGQLKKDAQGKIERLQRTKETARFYELYEETKKQRNILDYDDVLEQVVQLVEVSEEARDTIRERYLYVLVDEHQDSSGVQNEFLERVWGDVEHPNIFAVGDDRQLIYGFGGASLSHFEKFRETFVGTRVISLTENYRSTQTILDSADTLLSSSIVSGKLSSNTEGATPLRLVEAEYPRDEILAAGLAMRHAIDRGIPAEECVLLVPKNAQIATARTVLSGLGLSVASGGKASFLRAPDTYFLIEVLRVLSAPYDGSAVAHVVLNPRSGVPTLAAHAFLHDHGYKLSLETLRNGSEEIVQLGSTLEALVSLQQTKNMYSIVQEVAEQFFFTRVTDHAQLLEEIEIVRTMLHLVLSQTERNPQLTLTEFISFLDRLILYGQDIPLAVFGAHEGVQVMTLHSSKGLEFDFVWIAHMDERSLMRGKTGGFVLPEKLAEQVHVKDELTAKRELYVAMTRARKECTLSYSRSSYSGSDQKLAQIITDLPTELFEKTSAEETEAEIMAHDPKAYVLSEQVAFIPALEGIRSLVRDNYSQRKLAVTHLNNFFSCPWKWYFRNFLSLPEPETESLQFGNLVHLCLEKVFTRTDMSEKDIPVLVEEICDTLRIADEHVRVRFVRDAIQVLTRFMQQTLPDISGNRQAEKKMSSYCDPDMPTIDVTGKIDLIETGGDESLRVTDFKTGRPKLAREIEKATDEGRMSDLLRQLAMYSYLLMHEKNAKPVTQSRLVFVEADTEKEMIYETCIESTHIEQLRGDIKDYETLLRNGEWTQRRCDFKPSGTQKECQYCAMIQPLL